MSETWPSAQPSLPPTQRNCWPAPSSHVSKIVNLLLGSREAAVLPTGRKSLVFLCWLPSQNCALNDATACLYIAPTSVLVYVNMSLRQMQYGEVLYSTLFYMLMFDAALRVAAYNVTRHRAATVFCSGTHVAPRSYVWLLLSSATVLFAG